jgi:ankyrin repeat protein
VTAMDGGHLHEAARLGDLRTLQAALAAPTSAEWRAQLASAPDSTGKTPLHRAAEAGHEPCLRALLEAGAAVDATDEDSATALLFAAAHSHAACVEILVAAGASLAATAVPDASTTYTALQIAAISNHVTCVRACVAGGWGRCHCHHLPGGDSTTPCSRVW